MEMTPSAQRTVLVTGNLGYIGPVMVKTLKENGYRVVGLDTGWFGDCDFFRLPPAYLPDRQIRKDVRRAGPEDVAGIDAIVHLAALSNDPLGELNPILTDEINRQASVRLARIAKEAGTQRFIFASSCSVYGIMDSDAPIDESGQLNPLTAYAKAKVGAEEELRALADDSFHPVFLRNATVYGVSPRLRLDLVVNNLCAVGFLTKELLILSDGTPWRPLVHIEDFCAAFAAALQAPAEQIHAQAFNVGTDAGNYRVSEIAEAIRLQLPGATVRISRTSSPDERSYRVSFSKIRSRLPGFKPCRDLRQGIAEILQAYAQQRLCPDDFQGKQFFRLRALKALIETGSLDERLYQTIRSSR